MPIKLGFTKIMTIYSEAIQEMSELASNEEICHPSDAVQFLERCTEFDPIAEGVYATVYNLPDEPDKVVKVCTSRKDGYYLFARWCMSRENRENPHLPLIHREDIVELPNGLKIRFYVIERLEDITEDGSHPVQPDHFHNMDFGTLWNAFKTVAFSYGMDHRSLPDEIESLDAFIAEIKKASEQLSQKPGNDSLPSLKEQTLEEYDAFLRTLYDVLIQLSPVGVMDLHGNNFMLRGDTIVITDPLSHKHAA